MQVGFWPFWSQQYKRTGEFLATCGNVKQLAYLATQLRDSTFAIPHNARSAPLTPALYRRVSLPQFNPHQRVHWNLLDLASVFDDCDVAVTNSEYLAVPLRELYPQLPIIQMCNVRVDCELFGLAFDAADLVVAQCETAARNIRELTDTPVTVWKLAYDERDFELVRMPLRPVDVCFVQRCSFNNATHHEEFLAALAHGSWRAVFTDVTGFLHMHYPQLTYCDSATYIDTLHRSKVAISMYDSWYGGLSIREAIRAGCVPVVLDAPCYRELCGPDWPFYVKPTPESIMRAVQRAMGYSGPLPDVSGESYQVGGVKALEDIRHVACSRR